MLEASDLIGLGFHTQNVSTHRALFKAALFYTVFELKGFGFGGFFPLEKSFS